MPGSTTNPFFLPTAIAAGQFLPVLWSDTAMTFSPLMSAMFTMLLGVLSPSPQGLKQEWI